MCENISNSYKCGKYQGYIWSIPNLPYFLAHKTHHNFFVRILGKKNDDECILMIYWKKTGLLHTKISNHNIIYSS